MNTIVKTVLATLAGLSLLLSNPRATFADSLEEQTVVAALGLNIVRFTNWPADAQAKMKNGVAFCVVGDNVVQESFTSIDNKSVGSRLLHVIDLTRLRNLEQCHVLYISEMKQNVLLQLLAEIKKRPLLTIGKGQEFAIKGGMIGLENADGKIDLHINLAVVRESNLNISARLLKLAKIIGD